MPVAGTPSVITRLMNAFTSACAIRPLRPLPCTRARSTPSSRANIRTEGIDFPFPGYLENIVRQIALRFEPPRGTNLKAEVMFLIRRDGSITSVTFLQRSGSFTFDLEAQGAVEAAASKFGPLPSGFRDDVLPVVFSFDPRLIR